MKYLPYTYLIGWTKFNKWYYGVQYGTKPVANPLNLWNTYFTSCKRVREFADINGKPDVIQIRRTFKDPKKAIEWEAKVLQRLKAASNPMWFNRNVKGSVFLTPEEQHEKVIKGWQTRKANGYIPHNKGKPGRKYSDEEKLARSIASKGRVVPRERTERSAAGLRGKPKSIEHKRKLSLSSATEDHTMYKFINIKTQQVFEGTRRQFTERFYSNKTSMSAHLSMFIKGHTKRLFKTWIYESYEQNLPKPDSQSSS